MHLPKKYILAPLLLILSTSPVFAADTADDTDNDLDVTMQMLNERVQTQEQASNVMELPEQYRYRNQTRMEHRGDKADRDEMRDEHMGDRDEIRTELMENRDELHNEQTESRDEIRTELMDSRDELRDDPINERDEIRDEHRGDR